MVLQKTFHAYPCGGLGLDFIEKICDGKKKVVFERRKQRIRHHKLRWGPAILYKWSGRSLPQSILHGGSRLNTLYL